MENNAGISDINCLLIFAKVAENQSFTKAAAKLGIEKSTVSNKISDLEKCLGVRLLNRNTRSVALTESGEGYYQYCKQIIDNAVEAEEFVRSLHAEPQGLLRISGPTGIGRILFKDLFGSFLADYPEIDVEILLTGRKIDIQRDRIDIALRTDMVPPQEPGLTTTHVLDFEWGFYTSPAYLAEHGDILTLGQLEQQPMIHFVPPKVYYGHPLRMPECWNMQYPRFKNRITINQIDPCIFAIKMGLGVGILPTSSVRDEVRSGLLVQILTDYKFPSMSLYAVYAARQWQTSKLQVFLNFIEQWGKENTG